MWILRNFDSPPSPLRTSENKKFSLYSLGEANPLRSTVFELRERMFWSFVLILVFSYVDFMKSNSEIDKKDTECSHRVQSIRSTPLESWERCIWSLQHFGIILVFADVDFTIPPPSKNLMAEGLAPKIWARNSFWRLRTVHLKSTLQFGDFQNSFFQNRLPPWRGVEAYEISKSIFFDGIFFKIILCVSSKKENYRGYFFRSKNILSRISDFFCTLFPMLAPSCMEWEM